MWTRRIALILAAAAMASFAAGAPAEPAVPFSAPAFAAAQKAGKPILVDVAAPWCPICKRQQPVLEQLCGQPRFQAVQRFNIDFDTQKDALRQLGVRSQSTLIVYKGGKEAGRSVGQTQPEWIEDLLEKAL